MYLVTWFNGIFFYHFFYTSSIYTNIGVHGEMKIAITLFLGIAVLVISGILVVLAGEIDATTVVNRVIDGDTFDTTTEGRIRLADVDAPEYGQSGYYDAKQVLEDLVDGKTVYLDIDDIYETDPYGRLVCVVYIEYSSTHYKDVNKALLVEGVAEIDNYYNEFNPYEWTLTVHKSVIPEFPSLITLSLFMIGIFIAVLAYRSKMLKPVSKADNL